MPSTNIYQLKITLKGTQPSIWRRIQVVADTKLPKLHRIFQIVMGWSDYHLHDFTSGKKRFSIPSPEDVEYDIDERRVVLAYFVSDEKARFVYTYDFGDGWQHDVLVEKIFSAETGVKYPRCISGKNACPPEDVGGVGGYAYFLEAIANPTHPEHENLMSWSGGEFDPHLFDIDGINEELRRIR